jgi:oligopeptide/dipeptide ABC transporter ATP-binding protein|tara:strand:- start:3044 stop:4012 length:969 start_codon:yes stop_codon:yes gene_type:complete
MEPVLSIKDLSVDFSTPTGPIHALRRVNLSVPQKRIVGIVGESGSGKSTVVSAVMRLLANNANVRGGEIYFEGRNIFTMKEKELRAMRGEDIAMVFQDPMTAQTPVLSVGQQMIDIQYRRSLPYKEKRQQAIEMLNRVGIPDADDRVDQYPHQFSGGMRQRISIAMALMMNPKLLIADEPTTALDVTLEAQIIHLFRELRKTFDGSIIVVSHNLGLIAELCDEVVVMYAGEVVERAPVDDIFYRAAHPYTRALLNCDPARLGELTQDLPTIPGEVPDLQKVPAGCIFSSRCAEDFDTCACQRPLMAAVTPAHQARCHLLSND